MAVAWLSLGSNVAPEHHLRAGVAALREAFGTVEVSPVYRSAAVGFEGDPFLNAAARIETALDPVALDARLHAIEDAHGRRRDVPRFSSRSLDIDLLLYDDRVLRGPGHLELPRPDLAGQAFVLGPMVDLAPGLVHPTLGRTLAALWAEMGGHDRLQRIDLVL
ncbi:2-amino-4-hydroxy-6-hydroxymethyldihydropteridine diphosphokinase [Coralloluteibacterium thermophilus]|uniref:2-amino-4-hydroxy-6-hydroxymethyldihydropteridine pyrophosphokinase n=1 Tax=Coralloluteibacterium thermophilum TaxID=2707049 RepID=A0ABV9NJ46_9GAMM